MKWLTNLHDPRRADHGENVHRAIGKLEQEALTHEAEWLKGKVIGEPKATDYMTVEDLKRLGLVGIYSVGKGK